MYLHVKNVKRFEDDEDKCITFVLKHGFLHLVSKEPSPSRPNFHDPLNNLKLGKINLDIPRA